MRKRPDTMPVPLLDRLLVSYLRFPDHILKGRIERVLLRAFRKRTLHCTDDSGILYEASPWECVQSNILRAGAYEPQTIELLRSLLKTGHVMVDVGANVGEFSLISASLVGNQGRVIAIEASPIIYESLRRNISLNGFANVFPILVAAASESGLMNFDELPRDNWGMNRRSRNTQNVSSGSSTLVAARRVDSLLRDCNVDRCDVMKIDVEGMELDVLRGVDFDGILRPRNIILEYIHELQGSNAVDPESVTSLLLEKRYELRDVTGRPINHHPLPENNLWAIDVSVDRKS
jgi:FkbM family methyltransferase